MRTIRDVSAGLDLVAGRKKLKPDFSKLLDSLDWLDDGAGSDAAKPAPVNRPYSGEELSTVERWK